MPDVSNWNKYPVVNARVQTFDGAPGLRNRLAAVDRAAVRGMGRSYGDASLYPTILSSLRANKILAFDSSTGRLHCQGGVTLRDLLEIFVPRGWFLPVTPGTKFVTVGGAIAADVHGKNHHKDGGFCRHVRAMTLMLANGSVVTCSRDDQPDLFEATCGGMGWTGIILSAEFDLKPVETAYIREEIVEAGNLDRIMAAFSESSDWTYTVAWIDCLATGDTLGRSLLMRGEHARADELTTPRQRAHPLRLPPRNKIGIPFNFPSFALNESSVALFNRLYHWKQSRVTSPHITDYDTFFYPLDFVHDWNRIYGRSGFVQYQLVLPLDRSRDGLAELLGRISAHGWGSFLAVLKLFGPQEGPMSFPMEGYTLALDFPVRDGLFAFLDELDEIVIELGGRIYLAKDARMKPETFFAGYPNATQFLKAVKRWNPDFKLRSLLAERLGITP